MKDNFEFEENEDISEINDAEIGELSDITDEISDQEDVNFIMEDTIERIDETSGLEETSFDMEDIIEDVDEASDQEETNFDIEDTIEGIDETTDKEETSFDMEDIIEDVDEASDQEEANFDVEDTIESVDETSDKEETSFDMEDIIEDVDETSDQEEANFDMEDTKEGIDESSDKEEINFDMEDTIENVDEILVEDMLNLQSEIQDADAFNDADKANEVSFENNYNEDMINPDEYFDSDDTPKVLKRDQDDLLDTGYKNINDILSVVEDDCRDKGMDDLETMNILSQKRDDLEKEFLSDAGYSDDPDRHLFDQFREKDVHESDLARISDIMNSSGIKNVDISDFDRDVALDAANSLNDARKDFNDLEMNYFGSIQNQVSDMVDSIEKEYYKELVETNGDLLPDEEYRQMANQFANDYADRLGFTDIEDTFAWSLDIPEDLPYGNKLSDYNGVAINNDYASDYDQFKAAKEADVKERFKPIGCDTPRATMDHELGHEIDRLLNASQDLLLNTWYNEMIESGTGELDLSEYSKTSIQEFIAEGYSEFRNNSQPRDISSKIFNRLIELNKLRGSNEG